ncbi:MBL fold metallo-hydrolase [Candidatus Parcubacteria bacterium]|nr:MBL fold metallo-hydrolase [Candidatus Parcubacteria bacterium]
MKHITENQLDIIVFDVEHGDCVFIQTSSGETMLIDCGHKQDFSPAKFIKEQKWVGESGIEKAVITHHDSDHISDLKNVRKILTPTQYHTNNITGDFISKKDNPPQESPKQEYVKIKNYPSVSQYLYNDIVVKHFKNSFKTSIENEVDINYHSVITFVKFGQFVICFPGDINNEGITEILENDHAENFLEYIRKTDIFIAPHHGRIIEEERNKDTPLSYLLSVMNPDIIIVSDKAIEEQNQNTVATNYYEGYVESGLVFGRNTEFEKNRKVLTTRNDNSIHIKVEPSNTTLSNPYYVQLNAFNSEIENHIKLVQKERNEKIKNLLVNRKYGTTRN